MLQTQELAQAVSEAAVLTQTDLIRAAMELDTLIEERDYIDRADRDAVALASRHRSHLSEVLMTGQHYLSPLTAENEHYWPAFIILAKKAVQEHVDQEEEIKAILYDFVGAVVLKVNYPDLATGQSWPSVVSGQT